jgi:sigma54-dependent transcription regulator
MTQQIELWYLEFRNSPQAKWRLSRFRETFETEVAAKAALAEMGDMGGRVGRVVKACSA